MGKSVAERKTIRCAIQFESYIAHPYWPEREKAIRIQLHSGVNRLKNDDKKVAAIKGQCEKEGITVEEYEKMLGLAGRQWYRVDSYDLTTPIIIPRHQLAGCLVETVGRTPKAIKGKYEKDSFRALVQLSDFVTEKTEKDGVFSRFVKLETSNKRDLQENEFIGRYETTGAAFIATGTLNVEAEANLDDLKRLFNYAVMEVGVGASRKMGFGRGKVVEFIEK